ncbi:MAG: dissimilatory sulfite reductase D family protein [Thermodesulfobacteriota bacterium]|nr:dissimilatory sulfite reductase D family protein [Thermodesulfobacteriota bacterium]
MEELKAKIMEWANKQTKPKFYFKDMGKAAPELSLREIKKAVTALVQEEKLELWSSGSSSMYGVKGKGLSEEAQMGKHEE